MELNREIILKSDAKYEIVITASDFLCEWNCTCSLANQAYSNELLHFPTLVKAGDKVYTVWT